MDSGNPCSRHMLSRNNVARPWALVASVVGIRCTCLVSRSHTTNKASFPCASGSLVIKSAEICSHGRLGIELGINFPAGGCGIILFLWHLSHPSTYFFTSLVTPGHQ